MSLSKLARTFVRGMAMYGAIALFTVNVAADTGFINRVFFEVKDGKSEISKVIDRIPGGTEVEVLEYDIDGIKISYNNEIGYISSDCIDSLYVINKTTEEKKTKEVNLISYSENLIKYNLLSDTYIWYNTEINSSVRTYKDCYVNFGEESEITPLPTPTPSATVAPTPKPTEKPKPVQTPAANDKSKKAGAVYTVTVNSLNMRSGAGTNYKVLGSASKGTKLCLIEVCKANSKGEIWYKMSTASGSTVYVLNDFVKYAPNTEMPKTDLADRGDKEETKPADTNKAKADDIIAYAKKFLGVRYVYGGSTPSGFDCSGFTSYVFKQNGYSITRTSTSQARDGVAVSKSNLQKGDLVFFSSSRYGSSIGHVGIYIGGGEFIHAASGSSMRVMISSLNNPYYVDAYKTARRIIK